MSIQAQCSCGRSILAPDRLAGQTSRCPSCAKPISVPEPGEGPPISVKCSCGKGLTAPGKLAGKKARCPGCGAAINIPGAPPVIKEPPSLPVPNPPVPGKRMSKIPAGPGEPKNNTALKWVLIGCGSITLLGMLGIGLLIMGIMNLEKSSREFEAKASVIVDKTFKVGAEEWAVVDFELPEGTSKVLLDFTNRSYPMEASGMEWQLFRADGHTLGEFKAARKNASGTSFPGSLMNSAGFRYGGVKNHMTLSGGKYVLALFWTDGRFWSTPADWPTLSVRILAN